MKTIKIKSVLLLLMVIPLISMAQYKSPVEKLYEKYAGEDGFTSVNVSKELFQMIMKIEVEGDDTKDIKEMQNMMEQLDGLKVITFEDKEDPAKAAAIYKEFSSQFPSSSFAELMVVKEKGNNIRFLTKQDDKGKILELVMLAEEEGEVTVLSLVGRIDMSTVSKLSGTMKIQGMDKLDKMEKKDQKSESK